MYIHELARQLRLRKLDNANLGALALCALGICTATGTHEPTRAAPPTMVTAKRPDDPEQSQIADGPESARPRPVFVEPSAPAMPPGRGMTYAMQQPDQYWPYHGAIQSSAMFRNAVLLNSLTEVQKAAEALPVNGLAK